jgi:hypothetical protein
MGLDGDVTIT